MQDVLRDTLGTYPRVLVVVSSSSLAGEELEDAFDDDPCGSFTNVSFSSKEEGNAAPTGTETVHSAAPPGWVVVVVPISGARLLAVVVGLPFDTSP